MGQVVSAVRRSIDLEGAELSKDFFPAHLTVALVDAVFTPRLRYYTHVAPIIERYCRQFGLRRLRDKKAGLPPIDQQETLTDLIAHYEELGPGGIQSEIVQSEYCSPGTKILKSENVRRAAVALLDAGIETLQDMESRRPEDIKRILRPLPGISDRTIHMFLMYWGTDDLVKGDVHVMRFVATALDMDRVLPEQAERVVAEAARELGVAPRLLDYKIWEFGAEPQGA